MFLEKLSENDKFDNVSGQAIKRTEWPGAGLEYTVVLGSLVTKRNCTKAERRSFSFQSS